ncbi:MAG: hypothetical protein WCT10_03935 [Patescibacteria group bacterium]|jgi:hypothetical protein
MSEESKKAPAEKEAAKAHPVQIVILLTLAYLVLSAAAGAMLGIKFPQPFFHGQPRAVIFASPDREKPYNRNIDTKELQRVLNAFHYDRKYEKYVFDCSDMSKLLARYLQEEKGYDTSVIADDVARHGWVYVWTGAQEAWAIEVTEETALLRGSSGEILGDDWWDYFWSYKNILDPRSRASGGPAEFYYPTRERADMHVFEWTEVTDEM